MVARKEEVEREAELGRVGRRRCGVLDLGRIFAPDSPHGDPLARWRTLARLIGAQKSDLSQVHQHLILIPSDDSTASPTRANSGQVQPQAQEIVQLALSCSLRFRRVIDKRRT